MTTITETHLSAARLSRRGKVRELYDLGSSLLLVASDRISAFDVVLTPGIPDKGKILTQLSTFWFRKFWTSRTTSSRPTSARFPEELRADAGLPRRPIGHRAEVRGHPVRVRGARIPRRLGLGGVPEERARSAGSGFPTGLREADQLPEPIFTPATKAETGHDENISFETMARAAAPPARPRSCAT